MEEVKWMWILIESENTMILSIWMTNVQLFMLKKNHLRSSPHLGIKIKYNTIFAILEDILWIVKAFLVPTTLSNHLLPYIDHQLS